MRNYGGHFPLRMGAAKLLALCPDGLYLKATLRYYGTYFLKEERAGFAPPPPPLSSSTISNTMRYYGTYFHWWRRGRRGWWGRGLLVNSPTLQHSATLARGACQQLVPQRLPLSRQIDDLAATVHGVGPGLH